MQTGFAATVLYTLASVAPAAAQPPAPRYAVIAVPTLGGPSGTAIGVNASGQVAGSSDNALFVRHATVWSLRAELQDLESGSPGLPSEASGINDFGDVVGYRQTAVFGSFIPTLWTADGARIDLPAPSGVDGYAVAINAGGGIVGTVGRSYTQAAYWDESFQLQILPSAGNVSVAWDISDNGFIAGVAASQPGSWIADRAALWRVHPSTGQIYGPTLLGSPSVFSEARALNERGTVVGGMQRGNTAVAFISPPTETPADRQMIEITAEGPVTYSQAVDVNERDEVVGVFGTGGGPGLDHAFYWSAGSGWVDLNDVIFQDAGNEWILMHASSINDRGEIVGYGVLGGTFRAFLLLPLRSRDV